MSSQNAPEVFLTALYSLREARLDSSLAVSEVAAPRSLAPWSAAVSVSTLEHLSGRPLGTSSFVLLCDPEQTDNWDSPLRLVGHARLQIDADQSTDPLLGEAIWQTVGDCLDQAGAGFSHMVGTVTRELSETFGGLELRGSSLAADLRCSWTPNSEYIGEQLEGWAEALRQNAGVEPAAVVSMGKINV